MICSKFVLYKCYKVLNSQELLWLLNNHRKMWLASLQQTDHFPFYNVVNVSKVFQSWFLFKHNVEVLGILSDDVETDSVAPGENLKIRLKGIEEEEILPGFILCDPNNLCHSGRTFDAQVNQIL